ncbi:hypothetical protein MAM1_0054d03545 [Mucor ambiguus]|uniref:G-patch domain-containing protein n=1 Tax=Mucor ambiguus TaxID=91626 RepID=A0A0C9M4C6_9FUNG|nr:hypothetical protein MAM1_0054d03545 [Mucor ambiguus]
MFNQQKPAFKFVIKSKIEPAVATDVEKDIKKDIPATSSTTAAAVSDEKKRKRTEKEATAAAPIATKKVCSQLERWNKKKEELKHESDLQTEQEMAKSEYADLSVMAFAVNKAKLKLQFIQTDQQEKEKEQTVEYRNRAAERRQAYGQPEKPVLSPPSSPTHHHRQPSMIPRREQPVNQASMHKPIADDNKGARMLANMGWKKGEGLGKDRSGILDPVKAESYAQSAGIGSTAKRDVGSGGGSYQSRTLDTARKRLYGDR